MSADIVKTETTAVSPCGTSSSIKALVLITASASTHKSAEEKAAACRAL
jgi:hypothetical protein